MAIVPLFVSDMDTLISKLRLTAAQKDDVPAIVAEAVQKVRAMFFSQLGEAQVNYLLGIPFVENGTTATQMLRASANSCEVQWVKCVLLTDMPVQFMDSGGQARDSWNQEGFTQVSDRFVGKKFSDFRDMVCDGVLPLLSMLAPSDTKLADGLHATAFGNSEPGEPAQSNQVSLGTSWRPFDTLRMRGGLP